MNKEINLSITTLKVEIKVLVLDGKRFTKSVFDQLPVLHPRYFLKNRPEPFGYLYIKGRRHYLFSLGGVLYESAFFFNRSDFPELDGLDYWAQASKDKSDELDLAVKEVCGHMTEKDQIFISI